MNASSEVDNVVLVLAGSVDGSGRGVYDPLKQDGNQVAVVQNSTGSLRGDVAATRMVVNAQDGLVLPVGHSSGAVMREAGTDDHFAVYVHFAGRCRMSARL